MIENSNTSSTEEILAPAYEPKRTFRWIFEVPGLDCWTLAKADCPRWTPTTAGSGWSNIFHIYLYDPIIPSASQKIYQWIKANDKRDGCLKLLDSKGTVVEKWNYKGLRINWVDFGTLDYSKSDPKLIDLMLIPDEVELEF